MNSIPEAPLLRRIQSKSPAQERPEVLNAKQCPLASMVRPIVPSRLTQLPVTCDSCVLRKKKYQHTAKAKIAATKNPSARWICFLFLTTRSPSGNCFSVRLPINAGWLSCSRCSLIVRSISDLASSSSSSASKVGLPSLFSSGADSGKWSKLPELCRSDSFAGR